MSETALLILDLQRDFLEAEGRMPIATSQVAPLLAVANKLIETAAAEGVAIVYVVNAFPRSQYVLNFFRHGAAVEGTRGAEVDPRVKIVPEAPSDPMADIAFCASTVCCAHVEDAKSQPTSGSRLTPQLFRSLDRGTFAGPKSGA